MAQDSVREDRMVISDRGANPRNLRSDNPVLYATHVRVNVNVAGSSQRRRHWREY